MNIQKLNDSPAARWTVLFIVATAMMMGYFVNDVMSPLETLLEMPRSQGGLGWTPSDYGFFSGAGSFINVFLLMLFFSGLILDKMGIRFTGTLACSLMVIGTLIKLYAVTTDFGTTDVTFFNTHLPASAAWASFGFAIFGVGYEMTGITVSKAMVRWFTGHELALAMGLQLAMARFGTAAALSISAPIARHFTLSTPLLVALAFLIIGLLAFLVFCVMDRRLDHSQFTVYSSQFTDDYPEAEGLANKSSVRSALPLATAGTQELKLSTVNLNPASSRFSQNFGYDLLTTCGLLIASPCCLKAYGAKARAMRWSS